MLECGLLPISSISRSTSRIRFAVIGLGHFAQSAVLPAIEQLLDVELTALVSGSRHKLDELGRRYGVRALCGYDRLDDLLASDAWRAAMPTCMSKVCRKATNAMRTVAMM